MTAHGQRWWNWGAVMTSLILINIVKALSVLLVDHTCNKFSSTQLDDGQAFYCSISKLPNLLNSWMEMELQTDMHTLQAFIDSIDARSYTHSHSLYSPGPLLFLSLIEGLGGTFPTSDCLLQLSLHSEWSHKSSSVQSGWTRGWGGGVRLWWRFHLSLSLLFSPLFPPCFFSPLLLPLLFLLLHVSIFSPPFLPVSAVLTGTIFEKGPFGWWRVSHSGN